MCIYIIGGKPKGKRSLGRPICRWVDNIKLNWTDLAEDREWCKALVKMAMNFHIS
jgi:hypothetical protein